MSEDHINYQAFNTAEQKRFRIIDIRNKVVHPQVVADFEDGSFAITQSDDTVIVATPAKLRQYAAFLAAAAWEMDQRLPGGIGIAEADKGRSL